LSARASPALRYLASRLATTFLIVLGAMVVLFVLTLLVKGDPASVLLGPQATPEVIADFHRRMGLDRPVHERLALFLWNVVQGDLGRDVVSGRPVLDRVLEVLPYTVTLTAVAIGLAVAIGVPLGCYAATHPGTRGDQWLAVASVSVIAIPNFVIAIYLLLVFSIWLNWLPVLGTGSGGWGDSLVRLILPSTALALSWVGYIARLMRTSLLDVLGEPFIRTSRAFGLTERTIVYKYALRNACIPTIAILGLGVGRLLGGAIFVEIIFARPGVGKLIYDAIGTRNYPVVQGSVLVVVVLFVLVNLAVDMSYAWIDPRLRAGQARDRADA